MSAPCVGCGAPARRTAVEKDGVEVAAAWNCDACFDAAFAEFEALQAQFAELLAAGVDRKKANEIMIARIEGETAS